MFVKKFVIQSAIDVQSEVCGTEINIGNVGKTDFIPTIDVCVNILKLLKTNEIFSARGVIYSVLLVFY